MNPHGHPPTLKPFQPGNKVAVGHGRPKGKSLTTILQEAMEKEITVTNKDGSKEKKTTSELLVASAIKNALSGNVKYFKEIYDRIEGKPIQSIVSESNVSIDLSQLSNEQLDRQIDRLSKIES